jgi:hypothetical protein
VVLAAAFPGDVRQFASPLAPLHFVLGVGSYGLFGAAVLHALMLDAAERRCAQRRVAGALRHAAAAARAADLPLRRGRLRRADATLLLGAATMPQLALGLEHKTVFSLLGWAVFARCWSGATCAAGAAGAPRAGCTPARCCCCWPTPARASCIEVVLGRGAP